MKNRYFNIVVEKILKYKGRVLDSDRMKTIISNILGDDYSATRSYKLVYYLKNRGYLCSLKKDIYLVKDAETQYTDQQLLETYYWKMVKQHCKKYVISDWYIGGLKALELNVSAFDVPDDLLIVNRYKQSTEVVILNKKIVFKTYDKNDSKLFTIFYKFTHNIRINNNVFRVANIELALLESLYNPPLLSKGYIQELVKKIVRKHKKTLDVSVRKKILMQNKHHSSVNRLYNIVLGIDPKLAEEIRSIIKKYSYFVDVS